MSGAVTDSAEMHGERLSKFVHVSARELPGHEVSLA